VLGGAIAGANTEQNVTLVVGRPALDRMIGQRIVTAYDGVSPDAGILRLARQGRIGGVILFGRNIVTLAQVKRDLGRLQAAARAGGNPPLLVSVDQEGGTVKRFASLPPTSSPRAMTRAQASSQGAATAKALKSVGVNVNLAPVADVTHDPGSFLYSRAFASPAATCNFAKATRSNGVIPTLKHFPGLGGAAANTDDASVTLPASLTTLKRRATAYRRCGNQGLVMVNSARYRALGSVPALLHKQTYALLRSLHVSAPTISDSLQAQALAGIAHAPIRAVQAGLDLLLSTGSERTAEQIYLGLAGASRDGTLSARQITAGAERIAKLKSYLR
jgi:beta-N-acetylhexosaminidase